MANLLKTIYKVHKKNKHTHEISYSPRAASIVKSDQQQQPHARVEYCFQDNFFLVFMDFCAVTRVSMIFISTHFINGDGYSYIFHFLAKQPTNS